MREREPNPQHHHSLRDAAAPANNELPAESDRDRVLATLGPHPIDIDEIGRAVDLPARAVRLVLVELDLAGRIERHGQHLVSLAP